MGVRAACIALVMLGAAGSAYADADAEAWDLLQRGTALYQAGDYEAARVALARARELVPGQVPAIDRWLGLANARLGRCSEAVEELERFLATLPKDPDALYDTTAARDGCKQALASRGRLRVETSPSGAEVRLDADDPKAPRVGVSPLMMESAPLGDHLVSVHRDGYQAASKIVSIAEGKLVVVQLTLVPVAPLAAPPAAIVAQAPSRKPVWKRRWFWPVVAGAAVAVAGVAVGVAVGTAPRYAVIRFQ
jgi:PEGA domain